jgi:Bardet-Biedl syndrome 1 protein
MNKSLDEEKAVSMLVVGTESKDVFILENNGLAIKKQINIKSVPSFIVAYGQFDVDYKLYIACRDGKVYVIKNNEVMTDQVFSIESKPVGLLLFEKQVVIAGMNSSLHSFYLKGKKNFQLTLPSTIVDIDKLDAKRTQ